MREAATLAALVLMVLVIAAVIPQRSPFVCSPSLGVAIDNLERFITDNEPS
jgi:hypothetical protein